MTDQVPLLNAPATIRIRGVDRPVHELLSEAALRRELGHLVYLGWETLNGNRIPVENLGQIAGRVRTESVIDYASFVSSELLAVLPPNRKHQIRHAEFVLRGSNLTVAKQLLELGIRDAFVHQEQLLSLVKLAVHHGQPGEARVVDELETIGTLLLAINDSLLDISRIGTDEGVKEEVRALVARRASLFSNESAVLIMGRYNDLLLRRPGPSRARGRVRVDFDAQFRSATGWSLADFMAAANFCVLPFLRPQAREDPSTIASGGRGHADGEVAWKDIGRVLQIIDRDGYLTELTARLAASREDLRASLNDAGTDIHPREKFSLCRRPLYLREDGTVVPLNLRLAVDNMSVGAYWALHAVCSELDPGAGVNDLTSDIGALLEDYVDDLLTRAYHGTRQSATLYREARRHFRHPGDDRDLLDPYKRDKRQMVDPSDALIVDVETMVVIEATARNLPAEAVLSGTAGAFDRYVGRIGDKFKQISRVTHDIANEKLKVPEITDLAAHRVVFPVVLLLHPFPQHYSTWDFLEEYLEQHEILSTPRPEWSIAAPQIITVEELELLEEHLRSGLSLSALLREKVASTQFRQRSMTDFMLLDKKLPQKESPHAEMLYEDFFERVRRIVAPHLTVPYAES